MVALLTIPASYSLSAAAVNKKDDADTVLQRQWETGQALQAFSFPNAIFHTWALYRFSGDAIRKVDNSFWKTDERWWKITPGETLCPPFFYSWGWCTYC